MAAHSEHSEEADADASPPVDWATLHISVTDQGQGMGADEVRVLNSGIAFEQVGQGQLNGAGGTGLGLGTCAAHARASAAARTGRLASRLPWLSEPFAEVT